MNKVFKLLSRTLATLLTVMTLSVALTTASVAADETDQTVGTFDCAGTGFVQYFVEGGQHLIKDLDIIYYK